MISIVIPVRNDEKNLEILLSQINEKCKRKNFEIIVVDGYSTDKTREVAKKYGCKVILQDKKLGVANAKNIGVRESKFDVIVFLEADHRIKGKNVFEKIEKEFRRKNYDAATIFILPLIPQKKSIKEKILLSEVEVGIKELKLRYKQKKLPLNTTISIIKKSFFKKIGGYNEELGYGEDQEFAKRVRKLSKKVGVIYNSGLYTEVITSFKRLIIQGRWYGRNLIEYVKITKDYKKLLYVLSTGFSLPFFLLSLVLNNVYLFFLSCLLFLQLLFRCLKSFIITKEIKSFVMIVPKMIRTWGEILGLIERVLFQKKHKGR